MTEPIKEIAAKRSVEAVYTGGTVRWSANGQKLFSTCTNVVKVIDLADNTARYVMLRQNFKTSFTHKTRSRLIMII